jgi:hypothetical protein
MVPSRLESRALSFFFCQASQDAVPVVAILQTGCAPFDVLRQHEFTQHLPIESCVLLQNFATDVTMAAGVSFTLPAT